MAEENETTTNEDSPKGDLAVNSSLEQESTKVDESSNDDSDALERADTGVPETQDNPDQIKKDNLFKRVFTSFNPYLLAFIFIIVVGIVVIVVANQVNQEGSRNTLELTGQELEEGALDELIASESNIGTIDQTLNVKANAIFEGKILVKDGLDVAGTINVGGALSLPGITVAGQSNFEDVSVSKNLSILGGASVQGALTVQGSATIGGGLSVGGTVSAGAISADSVEFTGDLQLTRHIDSGGGTPSIASGSAVGGGGTVSISGNDTAGTVTINTGGSPPAGIFATITFRNSYGSTPSIQITPANSASGGLNYYVTRTSTSWKIGSAGVPNNSTTYIFDYFVIE